MVLEIFDLAVDEEKARRPCCESAAEGEIALLALMQQQQQLTAPFIHKPAIPQLVFAFTCTARLCWATALRPATEGMAVAGPQPRHPSVLVLYPHNDTLCVYKSVNPHI